MYTIKFWHMLLLQRALTLAKDNQEETPETETCDRYRHYEVTQIQATR